MTVTFMYPAGSDGWERDSPLISVLIPRVGDGVTGPDDEEYVVRRVQWTPWGSDGDLAARTLVILSRVGD